MKTTRLQSWLVPGALCLALALPMAAHAGNVDAGLYAAAPPPNSVFVRVVSSPDDGHAAEVTVGKVKYSAAAGSASAYKIVPAGKTTVTVGSVDVPLNLVDGQYYTFVVAGTQAQPASVLIRDPRVESKVKGLITFYNLTGRANLSLKTADGKAVIVPDTDPQRAGFRAVNSATSGFAVFDGAAAIGNVEPQTVERGNAYSSIAMEIGGKLKVIWVKSETSR